MQRAVVAAAAIAGCLGAYALTSVARAANNFDGVYEGNGVVLSGRCPAPTHPIFRVTGNHISSPFGGTNRIEADVASDGGLGNTENAANTTTTGAIRGATLTMDVRTSYCSYHYVLEKRS